MDKHKRICSVVRRTSRCRTDCLPNSRDGYWATAIPVVSGEDRRVLLAKLMCDCLKNSKIVLLKLEKAEEPPTVNSEAFLAAVVKNAPYCKQMYNENQKLAEL